MTPQKGGRAAILFILLGGLGVGTLAYYVKSTPEAARVPDPIRIVKEEKAKPPKVNATEPKTEVAVAPPKRTTQEDTVRLPRFGDDISDMDLAPDAVTVPDGMDAMSYLADRIASGTGIQGARALGVELRDHVAVVNYSPEVQKGMGSMEEGAFLRALQVGFGQFTDVDRITVKADGIPLESGHIDLTEPLPVVRPGEKAPPDADPKSVEP